jgi:hypothetical protein
MLRAYDFKTSVIDRATEILGPGSSGHFPWPADELRKLHPDFAHETFGLPQGLAISPILANLVLNYADHAVITVIRRSGFPVLYIRFCDDVLIASPNREACSAASGAYNAALERLRLPTHPPAEPRPDGKRPKSRSPYLFAVEPDGTPEVQFVGYSLRWDGRVSIRPSTIEKQRRKMEDLLNQALFSLRHSGKKNYAAALGIYRTLQCRLAARAAGRGALHRDPHNNPEGWAAAFPCLPPGPEKRRILRDLDHHRHKMLATFKAIAERRLERPLVCRRRRFYGRSLKHFGAPFSYSWSEKPKSKREGAD